ncbi:hypothetical protein Acsp02_71130 [Actinoplanes sp. NBRC 103695]|nr:hypothetical protein Acsp02_71130 [Actinoplanes sp. NBRC 103695]
MRLRVAASLFVSVRVPQQDRLYVCELEAAHLITAVEKTYGFQMHGFVRDDQLRIIDELRAGCDFWLTVAIRVSYVDKTPSRLFQAGADLSIGVESGIWLRRLADARRGGFFEVFVPLDGGTDYANAEQELEKAKAELLGNNINAALLAARKALETVRKAWKTANIVRNVKRREAADQDPRPELKRTVPERFAFFAEDLFAGLSGALHKEEGTKGYEYSRAQAVTLIASTSGLVAQLAEERRLS